MQKGSNYICKYANEVWIQDTWGINRWLYNELLVQQIKELKIPKIETLGVLACYLIIANRNQTSQGLCLVSKNSSILVYMPDYPAKRSRSA